MTTSQRAHRPGWHDYCPPLSVLILLTAFHSADARAQYFETATVSADPMHVETYSLTSGVLYSWETTATSSGGDPVMRLLGTAGQELAVDDNGAGGVNARIVFTAQTTGNHTVIIHSKSQTTGGTSRILFNGNQGPILGFAGGHHTICSVAQGHIIRTGHEPFGPKSHFAVFARGSSTGPSSGLETGIVEQSLAYTHVGTTTNVVAIVSGDVGTSGSIFLGRTGDGTTDADGDGLSEQLEREVGTCWDDNVTIGTWDCGQYGIHPADTDRDGITDFEELFGACDDKECLSVRRWGADPLHKDVYYQVDYKDTNFSFDPAWRDKLKVC